jgi:hypothetical protein
VRASSLLLQPGIDQLGQPVDSMVVRFVDCVHLAT